MTQSRAFAIEVQGRPAGIAVAERGGFTFFVADRAFSSLDGRFFRRVDQAERAARRLLAPPPGRPGTRPPAGARSPSAAPA